MTRPVVCLFEDSGDPKSFGLLALLVACCADRIGVTYFELRRRDEIRARPLNGVENVLAYLRSAGDDAWRRGEGVAAVLDSDRIHLHVDSPPRAPPEELIVKLRALGPGGAYVCSVLLYRNADDLVRAARSVLGLAAPLGKPTHTDRDRLLGRVAADSNPEARHRIIEKMPSFGVLVDTVMRLRDGPPGAPCPD